MKSLHQYCQKLFLTIMYCSVFYLSLQVKMPVYQLSFTNNNQKVIEQQSLNLLPLTPEKGANTYESGNLLVISSFPWHSPGKNLMQTASTFRSLFNQFIDYKSSAYHELVIVHRNLRI